MTSDPHDQMNDDAIDGAAAAWLVEREDGFSPGQAEAFSRWLAADARHAAAFARAEATDRLLRNLPRLHDVPALSARLDAMAEARHANVIRGPWWQILAAAAVLAITAAVWWLPGRGNFQGTFSTAQSGVERVSLPDHSFIDLGGNSNVVVTYSRRARDIALTRGEARFTVARDASRPFVVAVGEVSVRAVGTIFDVTRRVDGVDVRVAEGIVEITRTTGAGSAREVVSTLGAGQQARVRAVVAATATPPEPALLAATAPDIVSRLQFTNEPLSRVIAEFNRHNAIQLVLGDPELAGRLFDGTFPSNQVEALVRILEETQEISAERTNSSTIILRKRN